MKSLIYGLVGFAAGVLVGAFTVQAFFPKQATIGFFIEPRTAPNSRGLEELEALVKKYPELKICRLADGKAMSIGLSPGSK
jgi:hypothetical protein